MPRQARLDAPGTLHHVMIRGIEGANIFWDEKDRERFLSRVGEIGKATGTRILAWVLMDNHVHLLLFSGSSGLPRFMRRLLTGYALWFNRRHQRSGHLFQNRYKSIVCEEDVEPLVSGNRNMVFLLRFLSQIRFQLLDHFSEFPVLPQLSFNFDTRLAHHHRIAPKMPCHVFYHRT